MNLSELSLRSIAASGALPRLTELSLAKQNIRDGSLATLALCLCSGALASLEVLAQ